MISFPHIIANWKTSAQGLLSFVSVTAVALQGLRIPLVSPKINAGIAIAAVLSKAYIGLIQHDGGMELARMPSGEVKAVPSHEVPDDPKATPVKP